MRTLRTRSEIQIAGISAPNGVVLEVLLDNRDLLIEIRDLLTKQTGK